MYVRELFIQDITKCAADGRHECFPYFTTAIDTKNVRRVFKSCREIIRGRFVDTIA